MESDQLNNILSSFKEKFDLNYDDLLWFFDDMALGSISEEIYIELFQELTSGTIDPKQVVHPKYRNSSHTYFRLKPYTGNQEHPCFRYRRKLGGKK